MHFRVTIVTPPWHNCDTPVTQLWHTHVTIVTHLIGHFQFRSILTYLMMEFDFFSSQLYSYTYTASHHLSILGFLDWHRYVTIVTPMTQLWHPHVTIVTPPCHNCDTPMSQFWHTHATIVTQVCHNCDTPKMLFTIRVNFNILNDGIWFFFLHSFICRHIL